MPRPFGRGPYGAGPYSRDLAPEPVFTIRIFASSSTTASGRLLWGTIPVPPCMPWPGLRPLPPAWSDIDTEVCAAWPPAVWSPSLVLESPGAAEWAVDVSDDGQLSMVQLPAWTPIAIGSGAWPSLDQPRLVLESPGEAAWEIAVGDSGALSMRLVRAPIAVEACGAWPGLRPLPPVWAPIDTADDAWTPPPGLPPAWQPIAAKPCTAWAMA